MDKKTYKKELWIYSVLVVIGFICAGMVSPIWASINLNKLVVYILGIIAFVLVIYGTMRFCSYLEFKPKQMVVAVLLLIFVWPGSIIYVLTRRPTAGA